MIIKINIKKLFFELCMITPIIYSYLCVYKISLGNKFIIGEMIISYLVLNKICINKNKKFKFFIFNFLILSYVVYISFIDNLKAIIHMNFYSYLFVFLMIGIFLENDIRKEFLIYFKARQKRYITYIILFFILIGYTCIFKNGMHMEFDSSIPILFGPFSIPHMLGYILLVIYCGLSLIDNNKIIIPLKILSIILLILTSVRSAALAMLLLMLCNYLSIKNINKKFIIFILVIVGFFYISLTTDLLINNPIMQKTMIAAENGSVTNGREIYREVTLNYYKLNTNLLERTLGIGLTGVINVIYNAIGVAIHAHNDYVNVLVGYGLVGVILFIYSQLRLNKVCKNVCNMVLLQMFIFTLAYSNGFAMYMMLTASFPIILCFFEEKNIVLI